MPDKKKPEEPKLNPLAEAFKEAPNLLGLTGCATLSMATLNPLPLLVGMVAEAAYLLVVPDAPFYRSLLERRAKVLKAIARQEYRDSIKDRVLPNLPDQLAERYRRLESTRINLEKDLPDERDFYSDILTKMDHLLESFLGFAQKDVQFRAYLLKLGGEVRPSKAPQERRKDRKGHDEEPETGSEDWIKQLVRDIRAYYDSERASIQKQMEDEESSTAAVLRKRLEVLERRADYLQKIGSTLINLKNQMCLLEDTFGLISDQIRARNPEEVLSDVEDAVTQTDIMNDVLEQFNSYELA